MKIHPGEEMLKGVLWSPGAGNPRVLRHLQGCARCRSRLAALPQSHSPAQVLPFRSAGAWTYDLAVERSLSFVAHRVHLLERERNVAPGLLAELMERTAEQREFLLRNSRRFHTWGLFELIVDRSRERNKDPERGEEMGQLALRIAGLLDGELYGAAHIEDLRARVWAYVGNARRVRSDLQGAEAAFQQAAAHLRRGTGDVFERATFLDLQASLRRSQRRFDTAVKLLREAVSLFLAIGDGQRTGHSLVNLSLALLYAGRAEEGIPVLRQALDLIDPQQDSRLLLMARHNLVLMLIEGRRFLEAQRVYREAQPLYRSFPDTWTQNRRKWMQGRIAQGLGQLDQAEALFLTVRDGFLVEGIPYDTALVSLDLALLYAEQGRTTELKQLAAEMVPIFASRQIHREALAALAFLQHAVEAERVGTEVVERVATYLRNTRYAPDTPFQESP